MSLVHSEKQHFTFKDYQSWPEKERWELIEGEAFNMSPAPTVQHQKFSFLIAKNISDGTNINNCHVFIAPLDVLLIGSDEANQNDDNQIDNIVQPDIFVVCDPNKIREKNIKGAPDFIIEVLSPSTAKKDEGIKRDLYQKCGVEEYWLVHPMDRTINQYSLLDEVYAKPQVYGQDDTIQSSRFPELSLELNLLFDYPGEPEDEPNIQRI